MRTLNERQTGIVAILDALGASGFGDTEIQRFMDSRDFVIQALREKAEGLFSYIDPEAVTTFTFNDTVLIVLKSNDDGPQLKDIESFFSMLRRFIADSLINNILFRGAVAIGTFYVNDKTNTVMGQAVTDTAAWYDQADWIGVHATPRTSLIIEGLMEEAETRKTSFIVDWDVPLINGHTLRTKTVNWPRVFMLPHSPLRRKGITPRERLLTLLSNYPEPRGTESKFTHTLAFFDDDINRFKVRRPKK